jgi:hypothetical protein
MLLRFPKWRTVLQFINEFYSTKHVHWCIFLLRYILWHVETVVRQRPRNKQIHNSLITCLMLDNGPANRHERNSCTARTNKEMILTHPSLYQAHLRSVTLHWKTQVNLLHHYLAKTCNKIAFFFYFPLYIQFCHVLVPRHEAFTGDWIY